MKYIVCFDKKWHVRVRLYDASKCTYVPEGWIEPRKVYAFGDWGMKHPQIEPAYKAKPSIQVPGLLTDARNCRVVPDIIANELDSIDKQISELTRKKHTIIENEFMTFPLIQDTDLPVSTLHRRYETKYEANKAKSGG